MPNPNLPYPGLADFPDWWANGPTSGGRRFANALSGIIGPSQPNPALAPSGHDRDAALNDTLQFNQRNAENMASVDSQKHIQTAYDFLNPTVTAARDQSIKDAGTVEQEKAQGAATGAANAAWTDTAQHVADASSQRKINEEVAPIRAQAPTPQDISYLADQTQRDPSMLTTLAGADKPRHQAVLQELANRGVDLEKLTNQAKARAEAASTALPHLDAIESKATNLYNQGWFNPVSGRIRQFMVGHGVASTTDKQLASDMGEFQTGLGLLISNLQNIHAGARGAAAKDLSEKFSKYLSGGVGDMSLFHGQLAAARDLLAGYADENAPVRNGVRQNYQQPDPWSTPPSAAEMGGR